ncbi:MAG: hypothetical protein WD734_06805 [Dehalococcoidia bacterium]
MVSARGIRLRAEPDQIAVTPGEPTTLTFEVFNATTVVDQFELSAVGLDPDWVSFDPPVLSLFPSSAGTAEVTILIDSAYAFTAGSHVIGLRAQSDVDARNSAVVEVPVEVAPTAAATFDIHPESVRAGRTGAFLAVARNLGNAPLEIDLRGTDPEGALAFEFVPLQVTIPPGDEAWTVVQVRGRRPFKGMDAQRPFTVLGVTSDPDAEPLSASAMLFQKPWLPSLVGQFMSLLLLGAILVGAFFIGSVLTAPDDGEDGEVQAAGEEPAPAGALTELAASLERPNAGAAGALTVSFMLASPLPASGAITVTLPPGFALNADGDTALAEGAETGFDGSVRLRTDEREVTVVRAGNGSPAAAESTVSLSLTGVRNPPVSGPTDAVLVRTAASDGTVLDEGVIEALTVAPGSLRDASVTLDPLAAGATSSMTVSIALANELPPDGSIHVAFPEGFEVDGTVLDASNQSFVPPEGVTLDQGGTLSIAVEDGTIAILRNKDGDPLPARSRIVMTLSGIRNGGVSGPSGLFPIETRNVDGAVIDAGDAPSVTLSGGALSDVVATFEQPQADAVVAATLLFTMPAELPPGARIDVQFPEGYGLNAEGATTVQNSALAGADGTASAVVIDGLASVLRNNDGKPSPGGTAVAVVLTNVRLPADGSAPALTIEVRDGQGALIASGETAPVALAPAATPEPEPTPDGSPEAEPTPEGQAPAEEPPEPAP